MVATQPSGPLIRPLAALNSDTRNMSDGDETQSLEQAARILLGLIESDECVSLASVIERTGLSKSTAARLLCSLDRYVFLACSAGGRDQSLARRDTSP